MKKAVFFDIDGTLIDCFKGMLEISPVVQESIRELQENGHYAFIATGRPYAFLPKNILDFGFDGYILANGAHVMIEDRTVHTKPLSKNFVEELTEALEGRNVQHILEGEVFAYIREEYEELYGFFKQIGIRMENLKTSYDTTSLDIHKVEIYCPDEETHDLCLEFLEKHPDYGYFSSVSQRYLELYFKESTKAAGILKALDHLGVKLENTFAFGDGKNDIEMLREVGCGIAMGNASEETKRSANEITDTVYNDGVAQGIKKYILK